MGSRLDRHSLPVATILLAALGCLQPGIDPVFLTLLSSAHPVRPADHGWIVGATQAGMAMGSLVTWRLGSRLPLGLLPLIAFAALLASLATVRIGPLTALLPIRACYGLAMGVLYTFAMSHAAARRPNGAYGAVFLVQLVLSTLMALLLPAIAHAAGAHWALAALSLAPLTALVLAALVTGPRATVTERPAFLPDSEERHPTDAAAWALAIATLLFICATMMVWSFTGALAIAAGISEDAVGRGVAIGSLAGAVTAACVMREKLLMPLPLTGFLSGVSLLSPIAAAQSGDATMFILSIVLLNIGSTAIIIRGSGMATARSKDALFRRLVTCTHSGGMIIGPVIASIATAAMGDMGLLLSAILAIMGGCLALLFATVPVRPMQALALGLRRCNEEAIAIIQ